MSYEDMTDFEINKAVAETKGLKIHKNQSMFETLRDAGVIAQCWLSGRWVEFDYCNNPSDAWPIIIENTIDLSYYDWPDQKWKASAAMDVHEHEDKNPLRAAMIVYLRMNEDNG